VRLQSETSLPICMFVCKVLLGVAYNFRYQTGSPVSRCDISVYTCYYQCKCGGLKHTNSGACTLEHSVERRKRTQRTGRSPTGQRSVAE
jgi:hypothetical protein